MKKIAALLGLTLLGACSSDNDSGGNIDAKTITFNNFEAGGGWSSDPVHNNPSLVAKGLAHSGQYALIVDKDHEYSQSFDMPLGAVSSSKFKTLSVDAWVYMASDKSTANLGLQILQPDGVTGVGGGDLKFADVVKKYGEWVKISKDFPLPDNITAAQRIRVFMWRANASDKTLLDDVKLSVKE